VIIKAPKRVATLRCEILSALERVSCKTTFKAGYILEENFLAKKTFSDKLKFTSGQLFPPPQCLRKEGLTNFNNFWYEYS